LHLPKAGGTTLRQVFYNQYDYLSPEEIYTVNRTKETPLFEQLTPERKQKIKVLLGHFPFGLHQHLKGSFHYVTFMREPVERTISAYFYNKGHKSSDVFDLINENNYSLHDYLVHHIEPWSENAMTKHLAGCSLEAFSEPCTEEMFETAMRNLTLHFIAVGLTERFDESLLILRHKLSWSMPYYTMQNVTPTKDPLASISKETIELIKEQNKFDIALYEKGKEIFEKDWLALPDRETLLKKLRTNQ
jgi:hypothetical protein